MAEKSLKKILIVDDESINLSCARSALKDQCEVATAISGSQALRYLDSNVPDLILLDIDMPIMSGIEVMKSIQKKKELKDIPVIFLSANANAVTESECLNMGAVDFIAKPFVPSVLSNRINKVLENEIKHKVLTDELNERIREMADIKDKSQKDVLTGLYNREYTEKLANEKLAHTGRGSLFMIDMDNFKAINDTYGHMAGDAVLKMLAETLQKESDECDIVCRIGGDEFIMFFEGETDKNILSRKASAIIADICNKLDENKYDTNSSISVGIAQAPDDGSDFSKLYNAADKALYHVKQNGKNSFHFFSDSAKSDRKRSENLADINYISETIKRSDSDAGAYMMDFDAFPHVFKFIARYFSRYGNNAEGILLTLMPVEGTSPTEADNDIAIEKLEQAISVSLRKSDVSSRYSTRQIFLVLLNTNDDNVLTVVERINSNFFSFYSGGKYTIAYDFLHITDEHSSETQRAGGTAAAKSSVTDTAASNDTDKDYSKAHISSNYAVNEVSSVNTVAAEEAPAEKENITAAPESPKEIVSAVAEKTEDAPAAADFSASDGMDTATANEPVPAENEVQKAKADSASKAAKSFLGSYDDDEQDRDKAFDPVFNNRYEGDTPQSSSDVADKKYEQMSYAGLYGEAPRTMPNDPYKYNNKRPASKKENEKDEFKVTRGSFKPVGEPDRTRKTLEETQKSESGKNKKK
ncbi:MAG: diguanylate cyclase [Lachnospiraceae bacterium]|nr:diguanylate cyclase [Lachnospiraceae bacterium]